MPLPDFDPDGLLPVGIHAASLKEVEERFGVGSEARQKQAHLLRLVVEAAKTYPTIKRILVWGSFITTKPEPNDLDYSLVVSVNHRQAQIDPEHRRFFIGAEARQYYGLDRNYVVIFDYPLDYYIEKLDFLHRTRSKRFCGSVEISVRGEFTGE